MRPIERIVVFGGIITALALSLDLRGGGAAAVASGTAIDGYKIATVDSFLVAEKLMATDEFKKKLDETAAQWQQRAAGIERELQALDDRFKVLAPNSPQVAEIQKEAQAKQAEYQRIAQERTQDIEKLSSSQLVEVYRRIRESTGVVGDRLGYTHVISTRGYDKVIDTRTIAATLQELLARPVIKGIPGDDITKAVLAELKLPE
jgi:Skp family chaperone for outer membrane proteins